MSGFNREYYLLPTCTLQQFAYEIHTCVMPFLLVFVPTLDIAAEDRVTFARPTAWCWIAEPSGAVHGLSCTDGSIRLNTCYESWFHCTVHIERFSCSAVCCSLCPPFIDRCKNGVFTIEWETTLTCTTFVFRCTICGSFTKFSCFIIYITIGSLLPRQMSGYIVKSDWVCQCLVLAIDSLLCDDSLRGRTLFLNIYKLHLKASDTETIGISFIHPTSFATR